jgi:hypothetical protein
MIGAGNHYLMVIPVFLACYYIDAVGGDRLKLCNFSL